MKKKLPWLKYDQKKSEYMDAKKEETAAKGQLEEAAKVLNDLKGPIEYVHLVIQMQPLSPSFSLSTSGLINWSKKSYITGEMVGWFRHISPAVGKYLYHRSCVSPYWSVLFSDLKGKA